MFKQHAKKTKRVPFVAALATLGLTMAAITMTAAPASATDATFTLDAGSLTISAPSTTVGLGNKATGAGIIQQALGGVTVTDNRGALVAEWQASVIASDFVTGGATPNETIAASRLSYLSGAATASSPVAGVFTGTASLAMDTSALPVFTGAAVGNNSATWNPTITVNVPAQAVAGTYTGTITHSVTAITGG